MEPILCGIDIGGTKLAAGLVDSSGKVLFSRQTFEHTCLDEECLLDLIRDTVQALCRDAGFGVGRLAGVGVGMTGHISFKRGMVLTTSNLRGFKNYPLAEALARKLGTRVLLDNDANCQALAECRFGAGVGYSDMVFITVSTGIGAGLILNNRLYRGHSGTAGELGHTIIEPHSDSVCTCGNKGCFMAHACALNLQDLVKRKSARYANSRMLARLETDKDYDNSAGRKQGALPVDGKAIYENACQNDPMALEIVHEYADYLAILLYNVFQTFNPPLIVMGGGLMNWGEGFFDEMKDKFFKLAHTMLFDPIAIVRTGVPKDSGIIGAAALLLEDAAP